MKSAGTRGGTLDPFRILNEMNYNFLIKDDYKEIIAKNYRDYLESKQKIIQEKNLKEQEKFNDTFKRIEKK
jgi:hypothetical protein